MIRVFGVDPGKRGYISILEDGICIATYPQPMVRISRTKMDFDLEETRDIYEKYCSVSQYDKVFAVIERQWARRGEGVSSSHTGGGGFMLHKCFCVSCRIPYECPTPQAWKKKMLPKDDPEYNSAAKATSIMAAKREFPTVNLKRTIRCLVDHDGKAESLLIALYGYRYLL